MYHLTDKTRFGWITIKSNGAAITNIGFALDGSRDDANADALCKKAWAQIGEWCAGKRKDFDLPLAPDVPPKLKRWLGVLSAVPYGATFSYGEFAKRGDMPKAPRAAGSACAKNPIPLIIPCHRILRRDGSLGNFGALKGIATDDERNLALKRALIEHEARYV